MIFFPKYKQGLQNIHFIPSYLFHILKNYVFILTRHMNTYIADYIVYGIMKYCGLHILNKYKILFFQIV